MLAEHAAGIVQADRAAEGRWRGIVADVHAMHFDLYIQRNPQAHADGAALRAVDAAVGQRQIAQHDAGRTARCMQVQHTIQGLTVDYRQVGSGATQFDVCPHIQITAGVQVLADRSKRQRESTCGQQYQIARRSRIGLVDGSAQRASGDHRRAQPIARQHVRLIELTVHRELRCTGHARQAQAQQDS